MPVSADVDERLLMRILVRSTVRSAFIAILALLATVVLAVTTTLSAALTLAATTALIVPGTGTPDPGSVGSYEANALHYYIETTTEACQGTTCKTEGVPYIAEFWPFPFPGWGGLSGAKWNVSVGSGVVQLTSDLTGAYNPTPEHPVVVFGYSQGATVASLVKRNLGQLTTDEKKNIAFVLIGNPNRPNGGLFERLALLGTVPILDATFGQPTPTTTGIHTTDIAFQYDGVSDFPAYPINLLADLNAIAGFWYIHGTYLAPNANSDPGELPNGLDPTVLTATVSEIVTHCSTDPRCQQHGDTTYVTIPTPNLPILQPLRDLGAATRTEFITTPLIDLIQPALRVLIETGYDRSDYGQPTPFRLIPIINPITFSVDFVTAVAEGIRAALNDIGVPVSSPPSLPSPLSGANSQQTNLLSVANSGTGGESPVQQTTENNVTPIAKGRKTRIAPNLGSEDQRLASVTELPQLPSVTVTKPARPQVRGPIGTALDAAGDQLKQTIDHVLPKPKVRLHTANDGAGTHTPAGAQKPDTETSDNEQAKGAAA